MYQADCIIVGGGIAGIQAAIQLGRYKHKIAVIDSNHGRSTIAKAYHNILGWPDGVSGQELRTLGKKQAENLGVEFLDDKVKNIEKKGTTFYLQTENGTDYMAKTVFLGTGITDNIPPIKNLDSVLGSSAYICPDCDGYEIMDKRTAIIGGGNTGTAIAMTLLYFSKDLVYINHLKEPIDDKFQKKLEENQIPIFNKEVKEVQIGEDNQMTAVHLEDGTVIEAEKAFTAFKGNHLNNELATQLGIKCNDTNHVIVNPRTKETNVEGVWAGGDLVAHSEQVTISMGDGTQAAIWIHKRLMGIPAPTTTF